MVLAPSSCEGTLVPSVSPPRCLMLGIDGSKGSIKAGKDADLILWDTDPLSPMAKRLKVFRMGVEVKKVQDQ